MKFPCLVDKKNCKTPIYVEIEQEGIDNYGEPLETIIFNGTCNYQDTAKTIFTAEKKLVEITGTLLIPGDIAPMLPVISGGTVTVHGVQRRIAKGIKARNPDGTTNHIRLELI